MDLTINEQFNSRYKVLEKLGSGGMGSVYKAHDTNLAVNVALKVLHSGLSDNASVRFHIEAKAAAKLQHPSIVRVFDFGQSPDGELYLVMEFIDGVTLEDHLNDNGPLDFEDANSIFTQICKALEHAHKQKVWHRDIKPSNIILSKDSNGLTKANIVDFGLAKFDLPDQSLTSTGTRVGSPYYMSPEQIDGAEIDQRSDIYALGCLIYRTLTGSPPYEGESYLETLSLHQKAETPKLKDKCTFEFPEQLENLVKKCLAKRPDDRFSSMTELNQALESLSSVLEEESASEEVSSVTNGDTISGESKKKLDPASKLVLIAIPIILVISVIGYFVNITKAIKSDDGFPLVKKTKTKEKEKKKEKSPSEFLEDFANMQPKSFLVFGLDDAQLLNAWSQKGISIPSILLDKYTPNKEDIINICLLKPEWILFTRTKLTTSQLKILSECDSIVYLKFNFTEGINAEGLRYLSRMKNVKNLSLRGTDIDDYDLKIIQKMSGLHSIDLEYNPKITKAGLMNLKGMPNLQVLAAYKTAAIESTKDISQVEKAIGIRKILKETNYDTPKAFRIMDSIHSGINQGSVYSNTGPNYKDIRDFYKGFRQMK